MQLPTLNSRLTPYSNDDLLGLLDLATLSADFAPESVEFTPNYTAAGWQLMEGTTAEWTIHDAMYYFEHLNVACIVDGDTNTVSGHPTH